MKLLNEHNVAIPPQDQFLSFCMSVTPVQQMIRCVLVGTMGTTVFGQAVNCPHLCFYV